MKATIRVQGGCAVEMGPVSEGAPALAFVDNALMSNGRPKAMPLPELWPDAIPTGMRFLSKPEGKWIFTEERRDHVSMKGPFGDRLIWTEKGKPPMQKIGTNIVALGIGRPALPPVVKAASAISPSTPVGVLVDSGGTHPNERTRRLRIAYETSQGVLAPGAAGTVTLTKASQSIRWTWGNVDLELKVKAIWVFAGYAEGEEVHVVTLDAGTSEWLDLGNATGNGTRATDFEAAGPYQYCTTFVREIDGIVEESGPSAASLPVSGKSVRKVLFSPETDGLLDALPDTQEWKTAYGPWQVMGPSDFPDGEDTRTVLSVVQSGGGWLAELQHAHDHAIGERLLLRGAVAGVSYFLSASVTEVPSAMTLKLQVDGLTQAKLDETDSMTLGLSRVFFRTILRTEDAGGDGTRIVLSGPHPWQTDDRLVLQGLGDPDIWANKLLTVTVKAEEPTYLYVAGVPVVASPSADAKIRARLSILAHRADVDLPPKGTLVEVPTKDGLFRVSLIGSARVDGVSRWVLEGLLPSLASETGILRWAPTARFFTKRRLWRTGTTGEWRLVAELAMDVWEHRDVKSDGQLDEVLATEYQTSAGYVVFDPPPRDLHRLREHLGGLWGVSGNTLRASEPGSPWAWPDIYCWTFPSAPREILPFNGGMCVLCAEGIFRVDGPPGSAVQSATAATDGCIAGDSAVVAGGRILYASARGILAFDGHQSAPIAPGRVPDGFWRQPSVFTGEDSLGGALALPSHQTAGYHRLSESPALREAGLLPTREVRGAVDGLAAFYVGGRYVAYWRAGEDEFQGHGMVVVDLNDPQHPVTFSGLRIRDAFVDEFETPWLLMPLPEYGPHNSFAVAYVEDYPNAPYTNPDSGPTTVEEMAQLPGFAVIQQTKGNAHFRMLHLLQKDGVRLSPEIPLEATYTVTVDPMPATGYFVVTSTTTDNASTPGCIYRRLDISLRGESTKPLPVGDYVIRVQCNEDAGRSAEIPVKVTPDWKVCGSAEQAQAWGGTTRTIEFIKDEPIEEGSSIYDAQVAVWSVVPFGGTLALLGVRNLGGCSSESFWSTPAPTYGEGGVLIGYQHIVSTISYAVPIMADSRAIYEVTFNGRLRRHAFTQDESVLIFQTASASNRMAVSAASGVLPGASVKAFNGEIYVAGGATAAWTWRDSQGGENNFPMAQNGNGAAFFDNQVNAAVTSAAGWTVGTWATGRTGSRVLGKLAFGTHTMIPLLDMGEPKIRPLLHVYGGELLVSGGSSELRFVDGATGPKNLDLSRNTFNSTVTGSDTWADPASNCGVRSYGRVIGYGGAFFDPGTDSASGSWTGLNDQGATVNVIQQDANGRPQIVAPHSVSMGAWETGTNGTPGIRILGVNGRVLR